MSKSNRQRRAATRGRSRNPRQPRPRREEPDLFDAVRTALADPDPMHLFSYVSTLLTALDPRSRHPFAPPEESAELPTREQLAAMFIDVATPESTALLAVIAALAGDDEVLSSRIRRELANRPDTGPAWLNRLPDTAAYRAVRFGHLLGDGDNIMLGVRLAGTHEMTAIVYVDHHLGTLVKDAFVVLEPLAAMVEQYDRISDGADIVWEELSLADARAWLVPAIEQGAITFPPLETESWPACRPLIEWIIREFPTDGSGYVRPQWDSAKISQLADRFFHSEWGRRLDSTDHRDLLESVLWYATDYGPGNPLRWSPTKVEILLGDWLPRKVIAPAEYLAKAPELLRAFVAFAHSESGVSADLTDEAVAAINDCAPEYLAAISSPGQRGSAGPFGILGLETMQDSILGVLAQGVGGVEQLDRLDSAPLPDEPFQWSDIADDVTPRVTEVLELLDRCCDELLDVEYRTVARRVLARVASTDPMVFRRSGRAGTAAAAVVWIAGKANGLFETGLGSRHLRVSDIMEHFGLGKSSVSQRAKALLKAGGFSDDTYVVQLGSPEFLVSDHRQWLVAERDQVRRLGDELR